VVDPEERDKREDFLDRSFELLKHISTICTAASLLILAVFRERPFEEAFLGVTLAILALAALSCLYGMFSIATRVHPVFGRETNPRTFDLYVHLIAANALSMLSASGVVFALYLADVPSWIVFGVFGVFGVLLAVLPVLSLIAWKKRRG